MMSGVSVVLVVLQGFFELIFEDDDAAGRCHADARSHIFASSMSSG
jgi:hypothetical protein